VEFWSYKPPFLFEITAFIYKVFGYSRWFSRLVIIFFSAMAVYFTFLLGAFLYNQPVGLLAAVFLLFFPLFFTQSGLFQAAVPLTALTTATLYFYFKYLKKNRWLYFVFASLLVLTKEIAAVVILSILIYDFLIDYKKNFSRNYLKRVLFLSSPIFFLILWMILNKIFLGWFLWPHNLRFFTEDAPYTTISFKEIFSFMFWEDYRRLISVPIFVGLIISLVSKARRKFFLKKQMIVFISLLLMTASFFSFFSGFLPRYLLFAIPLYSIFLAASLVSIFKKNIFYLPVALLLLLLMLNGWRCRELKWAGEIDSCYLDVVLAHQKMAEVLEKEQQESLIVTNWPMISEIGVSDYGFVNKPLEVVSLEQYLRNRDSMADPNRPTLVLISEHIISWPDTQELVGFVEKKNAPLVKKISVGKETLFLYLLSGK